MTITLCDIMSPYDYVAIFNQSSDRYGMKPTLPVEIAAVFPKRNRMMLFNGKRFHGVMVSYCNILDKNIYTCISFQSRLTIPNHVHISINCRERSGAYRLKRLAVKCVLANRE